MDAATRARFESQAGTIEIRGDRLVQSSTYFGDWDLAIADIRVIGEVTDQSGPWGEDWYLAFAVDKDRWFSASFNTKSRPILTAELGALLGGEICPTLVGSTDFASRVLYPFDRIGDPMFTYLDVKPSGWLGRIWPAWLVFKNRQTIHEGLAELF